MKLKYILIIGFILFIFSIGAINASENICNVSMEDNQDLINSIQNEDELLIDDAQILSEKSNQEGIEDSREDSILGKASTFNPIIDDSPRVGDKGQVLWVEDIPSNANGQFKVSVNSKVVNTHTITKQDKINTYNEGWTLKDLKISKSGTYSVMLKYVAKNGKSKVIAKYPSWKVKKAKPITLSLNKCTIKSSTVKVTLKAKLKLHGKVAKGKKITFKFNKKIYKAKTNKKGIAKVTIKKSVLKKLKVGKKVKYQAGYGKTTVKKTVKVKK